MLATASIDQNVCTEKNGGYRTKMALRNCTSANTPLVVAHLIPERRNLLVEAGAQWFYAILAGPNSIISSSSHCDSYLHGPADLFKSHTRPYLDFSDEMVTLRNMLKTPGNTNFFDRYGLPKYNEVSRDTQMMVLSGPEVTFFTRFRSTQPGCQVPKMSPEV